MNFKHIMLTLALIMCLVLPVAATGAFYESKYVPTDNTVKTDGCGELNVQTLTYHSLIGSQFTITRVDSANKSFVNGNRVDKSVADGYVKVAEPIAKDLDHTGRYNDRVIPGVYLITLLDGNGNQPEYAIAEVVLSQKTNVVFLGHGVTMDVRVAPKTEYTCKLVIDSAKYGIKKNTPLNGHPGVEASRTKWFNDLGSIITPLIVDNELYINANYPNQHYNKLFGDPYEGVFKQLVVRFHYECTDGNTKITKVCVWEDEDLNITKETKNARCSVDNGDEDN